MIMIVTSRPARSSGGCNAGKNTYPALPRPASATNPKRTASALPAAKAKRMPGPRAQPGPCRPSAKASAASSENSASRW